MRNGTIQEEKQEEIQPTSEEIQKKAPKKKKSEKFKVNLPQKWMTKGHGGTPGAGRPKKTEEQKQRERDQKQFEEALRGIKLQNIAVFQELQKNKAYLDIFLRTLESGARNGNPSTLKFMNEIIGNVIEKEKPREEPKIEIKILHQFS